MRSAPMLCMIGIIIINVQGHLSPDAIIPETELLESSSVVVSSPWVGDGDYTIDVNGTEHKVTFTSTPGAPTAEGLDFGTMEVVTDSVAAPVWAGTGSYAGGNVSIAFASGATMTGYLDNPKGDFSTELKWVNAGNATVMTKSETLPQEVVDKLKEEKPPPTASPTVEQLPASDVVGDILHPSNSSGLDRAISEEFPDGVAKDDHGNEDCGDMPFVSSDASINSENKVYGLGCSRRRIGAGFGRRRRSTPAPTPEPTAAPQYVLSEGIPCPDGYEKIYDDAVCGYAAVTLFLPIAGPEKANTTIPKHYHACQFAGGCAVDDKFQKANKGKVVFNLDKSERCDKGFQSGQAVCQLLPPTPAPTQLPTTAPTFTEVTDDAAGESTETASPTPQPTDAPPFTGIWAFKRGRSPGSSIAHKVVNTLQQCQNWCYQDSSCAAITYHSDKRCFKLDRTFEGNFEASDTCIVSNKETDMPKTPEKGWLLTSNTQTGALWDFQSGRSPGSSKGKTQQPSFKDCMDKCASINGCKAVVYHSSTDCYALNRKYEGKYQMSHTSIVANLPASSDGVTAELGWQITDSDEPALVSPAANDTVNETLVESISEAEPTTTDEGGPSNSSTTFPCDGCVYRIVNKYSHRVLYADSFVSSWTSQWGAAPSDVSAVNAKWVTHLQADGSYRIVNAHANRALFAQKDKSWGAGVGCAPSSSDHYADQTWSFNKQASGSNVYRIVNAYSGRALFAQDFNQMGSTNAESGVGASPAQPSPDYADQEWHVFDSGN